MNGVALVFFTLNIYNPVVTTGPVFSNRLFDTHQQCAEFVMQIAEGDVVDENYEFEFASMDGIIFKGGCYTAQEYENQYKN